MNVLERKKLKFRSFRVSEFQSFFVSCRRTYVLKNKCYINYKFTLITHFITLHHRVYMAKVPQKIKMETAKWKVY